MKLSIKKKLGLKVLKQITYHILTQAQKEKTPSISSSFAVIHKLISFTNGGENK